MPTTHGMSKTPLYLVYRGILNRCNNPKTSNYKYYGLKGVRCLFKNFEEFRDWAMRNGYKPGRNLSVERRNITGNYCAENCTFIAKGDQWRNSSRAVEVECWGEIRLLQDWCSKDNRVVVSADLALKRLKGGWDNEDALGIPAIDPVQPVTAWGETKSRAAWSSDERVTNLDITLEVIKTRLARGWTPERALSQPVRPRRK